MSKPLTRPASVVSQRIQIFSAACFLGTAFWLRGSSLGPIAATFLLCASYVLPTILLERWRMRPHRSPSAGLDWDSPPAPCWRRVGTKLFAFWSTLAILGLLYRLLPEYASALYKPFFEAAELALIPLLIVSPLYVWMVDGRMRKPQDGLWHFGSLLLGGKGADLDLVRQYALGWLVKGFFLPLMFSYLYGNLAALRARPPLESLDFLGWHFLILDVFYLLDVGCIAIGYVLTLRVLDTQIRSAEPTAQGWFWTLVCYQPFWGLIGPQYLAYRDEADWRTFFEGHPLAMAACSGAILLLIGIYAWASISFGLRFSNLTHRGIVTNGPYRFSRHPAYVAKNLSWWIETLPFFIPIFIGLRTGNWSGHWMAAAGRCLRLLGVNFIYMLRAWGEERHLSRDPVYVRYALWVERHGIFGRLGRLLPALRYRPPEGWEPEEDPNGGPQGGGGRRPEAPEASAPADPAEKLADAVWLHEAARAERRLGEAAQETADLVAEAEEPSQTPAPEAERRPGGGAP